MVRRTHAVAFVLAVACSDYGVSGEQDQDQPTPVLTIDPPSLAFLDVPWTAIGTGAVTVGNVGDAGLEISDLDVRDSEAFVMPGGEADLVLAPGETAEIGIEYHPLSELDEGSLLVESDDPARPLSWVSLLGTGVFPLLEIDPDPLRFGPAVPGCGFARTATLRNVSEVPLEVSGIATEGGAFWIESGPAVPLTLDPGGEAEVRVAFEPMSFVEYTGSLQVRSNEPAGTRTSGLEGEGIRPTDMTDTFRQPDGPWEKVDILFYVDQSGSMKDDQRNLAANFEAFIEPLDEYLSDYVVTAVTEADGCHNGGYITPETVDKVSEFERDTRGSDNGDTERGLLLTWRALNQLEPGECNSGFAREDAKTMLVLVSDEPDQSPDTWDAYLERDMALVEHLAVTAIVGDVPGGCGTAEPGSGYWEAALAGGGLMLSICTDDWGEDLHAISDLVTSAPTDTFELSAYPPVVSTLYVEVDGVESTDWTYDDEINAVVFQEWAIPAPLALIEIWYQLECEGV